MASQVHFYVKGKFALHATVCLPHSFGSLPAACKNLPSKPVLVDYLLFSAQPPESSSASAGRRMSYGARARCCTATR